MFYNIDMDKLEKLYQMKEHLSVEIGDEENHPQLGTPPTTMGNGTPCQFLDNPNSRYDKNSGFPITYAALPNGRSIPLLKTMLTSACEKNCNYCSCRAGRDFQRVSYKPEELARTFVQLERAGLVEGLFISSGIAGGGARTQDRLLATAEILRTRLEYKGYVHLKIMPGSEKAQVERAMQLADRVSVNLEAPNTERLADLAPQKTFIEELLQPLRWVDEIRNTQSPYHGWNGRWPSSTTQFVVGGGKESDLELLRTTEYLYKHLHLSRTYFSPFKPIPDTPLEHRQAVNTWRQHRLYQASFLIKSYPFELEDLPFTPTGDLPLDVDPKLAWAQANLGHAPIEINNASLHELMKVPGIGPKNARAILSARRRHNLHTIEDLKNLGVYPHRVSPFILINGKRPPAQLPLW